MGDYQTQFDLLLSVGEIMKEGLVDMEREDLQKWVANFRDPGTPMTLPDTSELLWMNHDGDGGLRVSDSEWHAVMAKLRKRERERVKI